MDHLGQIKTRAIAGRGNSRLFTFSESKQRNVLTNLNVSFL
jgi:hypothetical protein